MSTSSWTALESPPFQMASRADPGIDRRRRAWNTFSVAGSILRIVVRCRRVLLRKLAAFSSAESRNAARPATRVSSALPWRRRAWRKLLHLRMLLVDRRTYARVVLEHVDGLTLVVLPDVFNPKLLRSGEFLVQQLRRTELLPEGSRVLDMGSGSGASGIAAARNGCAVVSVDINPAAVRCTRINALLNNVQVDAREGDLFAPVQGERFDVVLFNPPYYRGVPSTPLDRAWRAPDLIERFSADLQAHLTDGGHAVLVLSSDGEQTSFLAALHRAGFRSTVVAQRDLINETLSVHRIAPC